MLNPHKLPLAAHNEPRRYVLEDRAPVRIPTVVIRPLLDQCILRRRLRPLQNLNSSWSEKAAALAPDMSFLGPCDRELDSDEELSFEEQFILRMPPGEDCSKLREMVASREISPDVWFKLKGTLSQYAFSKHMSDYLGAVFHIGDNMYSAKLVDLPCVIEAQKTLDNKKVADICQV
jgi:transcription initiation factor TFIID subunit 7